MFRSFSPSARRAWYQLCVLGVLLMLLCICYVQFGSPTLQSFPPIGAPLDAGLSENAAQNTTVVMKTKLQPVRRSGCKALLPGIRKPSHLKGAGSMVFCS